MRIGVYAAVPRRNGGVFQYTLTLLEMLRALDLGDDVVVLHGQTSDLPASARCGERWSSAAMPRRLRDIVQEVGVGAVGDEWARRVWYYANRLNRRSIVLNPDRQPPRDRATERWYRDRGLDLIMYPIRSDLAFETRVPSVVTVHDLNHRVDIGFPEARALGEYERREYYFRNACRHATTLLVDSDASRDDLLTFYADTGLDTDRVVVLPLLPSPAVRATVSEGDRRRVRQRYGLGSDFLFYPAQFWPHKNHAGLIQALYHLKQAAGLTPILFLGGSYSGSLRRRTFTAAMRIARQLGMDRQVRYAGFIPEEDMAALYKESAGLVIPTLFEGANIPVLEAFSTGCPVVTSDIRGIREQTDGAAILVDPRNPEAIAEGLRRLLSSSEERTRLIRRGLEVTARYTPEDYRRRLQCALEATKARLRNAT